MDLPWVFGSALVIYLIINYLYRRRTDASFFDCLIAALVEAVLLSAFFVVNGGENGNMVVFEVAALFGVPLVTRLFFRILLWFQRR